MKFSKLALATAALGLMAAPVAAEEARAERASAPVTEANNVEGSPIWLLVLAAAAVIAGVVVIADDNDNSLSA